MKSVKEVVRKALLNNGTKDDMYKDIVAEFGCSRHAAMTLLHSFIWECSEAYMVHVALENSHLLGDVELSKNEEIPVKLNTLYFVESVADGSVVGTIHIERECDGKYVGYGEASQHSEFANAHWIVEKDGNIQINGKNVFKLRV